MKHSTSSSAARAFRHARLAVLPIAGALSACAADPSAGPSEATGAQGNIAVNVAPLDLPGVNEVKYTVIVRNSDGEIVFDENAISSNQFGDGDGAISYVGACDAQDNDASNNTLTGADFAVNTVELIIEDVYVNGGIALVEGQDFENPCPAPGFGEDTAVCVQSFGCTENQDTRVEFSVTIMRDANQGFFDIAINFEDIFCSAKLDCSEDFLSADVDGAGSNFDYDRARTEIVGLACAAGEDQQTAIYLDQIVLDCGASGIWRLDPTVAEGTQLSGTGTEPGPVAQWGVFAESEELRPYVKGFWNVAIALKAGEECTISTSATASSNKFADGWSPINSRYPVIRYSVDASADSCHLNQPLDGPGSGVQTGYLDLTNTGECFAHVGFVARPTDGDGVKRLNNSCDADCIQCDRDLAAAMTVWNINNETVSKFRAKLDDLKAEADDVNRQYQADKSGFENFIAATQAQLQALNEGIADLNQRIADAQADLDDNANDETINEQTRQQRARELQSLIAQLEAALSDSQAAKTSAEAKLQDAQADYQVYQARYNQWKQEIDAKMQAVNQDISAAVADLESAAEGVMTQHDICDPVCNDGAPYQSVAVASPAPA